ncbi:hypothetical protein JCM3765_004895 [Sporobolomyces pararoseus]
MSKPIAPIPNVSLPPGGLYGRRATWIATQENNNNNDEVIRAPSALPPPPPSSLFNNLDQEEIDPTTALEIRRASIATLPQARWRTSTPTRTSPSPSSSIPLVGPQALVAELAKFDNGTPYEELRYVMELTAAQASQGIYPISSSSSSSVSSSSPPGGRAYSPTGESSFYAESDSTLPQARDAMDPILSPAARRYLDEYNLGQHRLPCSPPSHSHSHSIFNAPQYPYYPVPPSITSPSTAAAAAPPFVVEPSPLSTFPFGPIQPSTSYFPGPAITPIPPILLPGSPSSGAAVPTFDFQLDPSPSIGGGGNQFSFSSSTTGSLSPSFTSASSSSTPPTGFVFTPSTTPSTSPNPDCPLPLLPPPSSSSELDPKSVTEQFLLLRRQKKKSLVRLCAEEHARTKGAVKSWGIVKFFDGNKGWGFILDQSRVPGEDVWTHYTNLEIPRGHRFLVSEEVVEYLIVWDSKKSQLKALLVTGLGGTPLLAFSDPTLAASLTKFKPSQGPLPPTLSPNTKKQIYAAKREKQRKLDEEVKKERMKRYLERELIRKGMKKNVEREEEEEKKKVDDDDDDDEEAIEIRRGLLNFGVIGIKDKEEKEKEKGSGLIGLGLSGIEEVEEEGEEEEEKGNDSKVGVEEEEKEEGSSKEQE